MSAADTIPAPPRAPVVITGDTTLAELQAMLVARDVEIERLAMTNLFSEVPLSAVYVMLCAQGIRVLGEGATIALALADAFSKID